MTSASGRRRRVVQAAAVDYGGALSRAMLLDLGADRHVVAREVAAERWRVHGQRTVAMHCGELSDLARCWRAVWEVGCGAVVDGVSALHAAGLAGFADPLVYVSVPHHCRPGQVEGVSIHRVTRLATEVLTNGLPRTRPAVAAIRAASWATSDRQAALLLAMPVQQRLVNGVQLTQAAALVHGRRRRALIPQLVSDVVGGAQSLGELDLVSLCRRHGLPVPDRQVVVTTPSGRIYLDARWWAQRLPVEIDGSGHRTGLSVTDDNLCQNWVVIRGDRVLRIDLLGMRLCGPAFVEQLRVALTAEAA